VRQSGADRTGPGGRLTAGIIAEYLVTERRPGAGARLAGSRFTGGSRPRDAGQAGPGQQEPGPQRMDDRTGRRARRPRAPASARASVLA